MNSDMMKEINVSVIIPMYNVANVMGKCLDSLLVQGLDCVELLFVDDCSHDNTVEKINRWISEHESTNLVCNLLRHQVNSGVAEARNTGLDAAHGKYIYYVDADDYIEPNTLSRLYIAAENNQVDIVGCEWFLTFSKNERHIRQSDVHNGKDLFDKLTKGVMRWNLWLFLVKRSLYEENHFRFIPKMNMGEDMMVMLKLALTTEKVLIVHEPLYHYIQTNSNSLTKSFYKSLPQVAANVAEVERFIESVNKKDLEKNIRMLQLNVKLPLLISSSTEDFKNWLKWFPEANAFLKYNDALAYRTVLIQRAARAKQYWFLKLYYWLVIKLLYGVIYR